MSGDAERRLERLFVAAQVGGVSVFDQQLAQARDLLAQTHAFVLVAWLGGALMEMFAAVLEEVARDIRERIPQPEGDQ